MKKVNHHRLPCCYQTNFSDKSGSLTVLEIAGGRVFSAKPHNILATKHFYTVKFPGGGGSLAVEDRLADIEGRFAAVFRSRIEPHLELSPAERVDIARFVGTMMIRTAANRSAIVESLSAVVDRADRLIAEFSVDGPSVATFGSRPSGDPGLLAAFRKAASDPNSFHSMVMLAALPSASRCIAQMKWNFVVIDGTDEFITSDCPCVLINLDLIRAYGPYAFNSAPCLAQRGVELTLPLSSRIALVAGWKLHSNGYAAATPNMVRTVNARTVSQCHEVLLGSGLNALHAALPNGVRERFGNQGSGPSAAHQ